MGRSLWLLPQQPPPDLFWTRWRKEMGGPFRGPLPELRTIILFWTRRRKAMGRALLGPSPGLRTIRKGARRRTYLLPYSRTPLCLRVPPLT